MLRKGSYFYVIDAFIASLIIMAAVFALFSRFITQQSPTQAFYTAEDFLSTAETTQIGTYDHPTIRQWRNNGTIADTQRSVLEQLVLFKINESLSLPPVPNNTATLAKILADSAPQQVGINISIDGKSYYSRGPRPMNDADTVLTAKRIVVLRQQAWNVYPPAIVEVQTWQ